MKAANTESVAVIFWSSRQDTVVLAPDFLRDPVTATGAVPDAPLITTVEQDTVVGVIAFGTII